MPLVAGLLGAGRNAGSRLIPPAIPIPEVSSVRGAGSRIIPPGNSGLVEGTPFVPLVAGFPPRQFRSNNVARPLFFQPSVMLAVEFYTGEI